MSRSFDARPFSSPPTCRPLCEYVLETLGCIAPRIALLGSRVVKIFEVVAKLFGEIDGGEKLLRQRCEVLHNVIDVVNVWSGTVGPGQFVRDTRCLPRAVSPHPS